MTHVGLESKLRSFVGRKFSAMEENEMTCFWSISGDYISKMYKKSISSRTDIG